MSRIGGAQHSDSTKLTRATEYMHATRQWETQGTEPVTAIMDDI